MGSVHLDKAPDAFRTISEVAEELEVPQHVLRFWETRFTQIRPMKRSGGRRYYRPDDVDLLRGIRRLLYGEGYTIRGVQRILKEHGIKAVQALTESGPAAFGPIERGGVRENDPQEDEAREDLDLDADAFDGAADDDDIDDDEDAGDAAAEEGARPERREPVLSPSRRPEPTPPPMRSEAGEPALSRPAAALPAIEHERLRTVLADLVACRRLLDEALSDG